jgi:hypothetical protein
MWVHVGSCGSHNECDENANGSCGSHTECDENANGSCGSHNECDENANGSSNEDHHVNKSYVYSTLFPESILTPLITFFFAERKSINYVNWSNYAERY